MIRYARAGLISASILALSVSLAIVACSKDSTSPTDPEEVRINITATITQINDSDNLLGGNFSVGDQITGYYIYDSTLEDENALETVGDYRHTTVPYGIFLACNGFEFETDPFDVNFLVEIINDHGTSPMDNYLLVSYNNLPLSATRTISLITWQLDDDTAEALDNTELGLKPPVLDDWESVFGLNINGEDTGGMGYMYLIRAQVTQVSRGGG